MSTWREENDPCPLRDISLAALRVCLECKYFRGGSYTKEPALNEEGEFIYNEDGKQIFITHSRINCNWPINGSEIDPNPAHFGPPNIPDIFLEAFEDGK